MERLRINTKLHIGLVVLVGLFLAVPYFSTDLLLWSDALAVRALLIGCVLLGVSYSPLLGIVMFLLVSRIFLERNNRKLLEAKAVITNNSVRKDVVVEETEGEIADAHAKVEREVGTGVGGDLDFLPNDDMGSDMFAPIGADSIDSKMVLQSTVEGSAAAHDVFGDQVINPDISNTAA